MKKAQENYFTELFEEPLQVEREERYRLSFEVDALPVEAFVIPDRQCVSPAVMDENKKFHSYHLDEGQYYKRPIVLPGNQKPRQIALMDDTLVLRYANRIDIMALSTDDITAINVKAERFTTGDGRIFVHEGATQDVTVYDTAGAKIAAETVTFEGKLLGMDFTKQLHLLTAKTKKVYLDGVVCENITATAISTFGMLKDNDFIAGYKNSGIHHYRQSEKTLQRISPISAKAVETDCMGRVWVLSEQKIFVFEMRLFYEFSKWFAKTFDSYKEDTRWHRLALEADIPSETSIEITVKDGNLTNTFTNVRDILLYDYKGQELTVELTLHSDSSRQSSPAVRCVKAVFDKTRYIDYLPAYYRDDPDSRKNPNYRDEPGYRSNPEYRDNPETLERFLSIFQTVTDETQNAITATPSLLDADATSESFLGWLSEWVGLARDYRWPEEKWRLFLRKAPQLYKKTGTKAGLIELIELYSGQKPEIVEYNVQNPDTQEDDKRFLFCVKLDSDTVVTPMDIEIINAIIDAFKPSHTQGRVYVDYTLHDNTDLIVGESVLPFNTVIE